MLAITGGSNPRTYSYDAAGRTTAITGVGGTTEFDYDYDGRVTQITYPNLSSDSYTYNGAGARATSSGVSGLRTFRRAGLGVTAPVLSDGVAQYTPGISRRENGVSTFQHSGLKNASAQSSASGAVTASRVYDAYGNLVSSTGTWQGPFGYGGSFGYQEEANGLKLLGHRYYDPDTGRFLTPDPIGDGKNWYAYAANRPVIEIDPTGLSLGTALAGALRQIGKIPFLKEYDTEEEAAIAALEYIYGWSVEDEIERGGWIIESTDADGVKKYRPTLLGDQEFAKPGEPNNKFRMNHGWPPAGATASYHTHPAHPSMDESPHLTHSPKDRELARFHQVNSYVVGYDDVVYKYNGVTQEATTLRKIVRGE